MPKNRSRLYAWLLGFFIVLLLSMGGSAQAQSGNRGRSNFDWILARHVTIAPLGLEVAGDTSLGDVTVDGNISVSGVITTSGIITAGNLLLPGSLSVAGTTALAGNLSDSNGALNIADDAIVTGNAKIGGTTAFTGSLSDPDSAVTVADNLAVTGQTDAVQLTVKGAATNTNDVFDVQNSAGANEFRVSNTGSITTTGRAAVGTFLVMTPASVITVTNGATLTPLGSYQPLASAGAVGFGAITLSPAGTLLTLINTVNQTITLTDTTTVNLSASTIALGQYDTLLLISDGAHWIQRATSNN